MNACVGAHVECSRNARTVCVSRRKFFALNATCRSAHPCLPNRHRKTMSNSSLRHAVGRGCLFMKELSEGRVSPEDVARLRIDPSDDPRPPKRSWTRKAGWILITIAVLVGGKLIADVE